MAAWILGTTGFVLYFIYDVNSLKWRSRIVHQFFWAGTLCLAVSAVQAMIGMPALAGAALPGRAACIAGGVLFFALLAYTLFFAIPFGETYVEDSRSRSACTEGVYALCRHPGILWFAGLFLCLWGVTGDGSRGVYFISMIVWNYLYAVFQDRWTFPKTFVNYKDYQRGTPFLLPDRKSIRRCFGPDAGARRGRKGGGKACR